MGRSLGNDVSGGLNLWFQHGVLVLRVDDDWGPEPTKALTGGERLLVGFTDAALSRLVQPPQGDPDAVAKWTAVQEWLLQGSLYEEPVPLISLAHRALEGKQLAAIDLQRRYGFFPKVIGILRADHMRLDEDSDVECLGSFNMKRQVDWFPGGCSEVRPGDELLCHADIIDVQLLEPKFGLALEDEICAKRSLLQGKLAEARARLGLLPGKQLTRSRSRSVSPITEPESEPDATCTPKLTEPIATVGGIEATRTKATRAEPAKHLRTRRT